MFISSIDNIVYNIVSDTLELIWTKRGGWAVKNMRFVSAVNR